jgi:carboxyl-terminal processing protease
MSKRVLFGGLVAALVLNLLVGAHVYRIYADAGEADDPYDNLKLFTMVLERVRKDYVDGDKLSYDKLVHEALEGMLGSLDPHSEFLDQRKFNDLREETEGAFGGVGLVVSKQGEALVVISPIDGTPAARAGILSGDQILRISGRVTDRLKSDEAVELMRGAPGTEVELTLLRPSTGETRDLKLKRDVIKVETVKDINGRTEFPVDDRGIGYVRIVQFGEQTSRELEEALRKLDQHKMKAMILDLRGNPGGLLDQAVEVCEKFLPRNQLVVTTEGRHPEEWAEFRSKGKGRYADLPVAILVNHGTASASEIVAGCLQDTTASGVSQAVVIGEDTFGKGSVQKIIPLPNGDALRLTTAKYYTPSHKVIHEHGITPDILVPMTDEQEAALQVRQGGGLDTLPDDRRQALSTVNDTQLERARQVLESFGLYSKRAAAAHPKPVPGKGGEKMVSSQ